MVRRVPGRQRQTNHGNYLDQADITERHRGAEFLINLPADRRSLHLRTRRENHAAENKSPVSAMAKRGVGIMRRRRDGRIHGAGSVRRILGLSTFRPVVPMEKPLLWPMAFRMETAPSSAIFSRPAELFLTKDAKRFIRCVAELSRREDLVSCRRPRRFSATSLPLSTLPNVGRVSPPGEIADRDRKIPPTKITSRSSRPSRETNPMSGEHIAGRGQPADNRKRRSNFPRRIYIRGQHPNLSV